MHNYIQLRLFRQEYFIVCAILYLYGFSKDMQTLSISLSLSVIYVAFISGKCPCPLSLQTTAQSYCTDRKFA